MVNSLTEGFDKNSFTLLCDHGQITLHHEHQFLLNFKNIDNYSFPIIYLTVMNTKKYLEMFCHFVLKSVMNTLCCKDVHASIIHRYEQNVRFFFSPFFFPACHIGSSVSSSKAAGSVIG